MTTPAPVLADPVQISLVRGQPPVQVCPPVGGSVLLYNSDETNVVNVGYRPNIAQTNSIPVQPLASVTLDGSRALYASLPTSATVQSVTLVVAPGGTQISASPAQINAQIAALGLATEATQQLVEGNTGNTVTGLGTVNGTLGSPAQDGTVNGLNSGIPSGIFSTGVPLYSKSVQFASRTNQTVGPGGVSVIGPASIAQIGYRIGITVKCPSGATHPFLNVQLTWFDSVTGLITSQARWTLPVGSVVGITYYGTGPTRGDLLEVDLTNPDPTLTFTYSCVITQNSNLYTRDDWRQQNVDTVTGFVFPNYDGPGNILANSGPTIAAGANVTRLLPLYAGRVFLSVASGGSPGFVAIQAQDPTAFLGIFPAVYDSNLGNGLGLGVNEYISLPKCPCTMFLSNTGSTSSGFSATLIIDETAN